MTEERKEIVVVQAIADRDKANEKMQSLALKNDEASKKELSEATKEYALAEQKIRTTYMQPYNSSWTDAKGRHHVVRGYKELPIKKGE